MGAEYKVLFGFEDLETGIFYDKGSDYQHEDDNRLIKLANLGLIEFGPEDVIEVFPDDEVEQGNADNQKDISDLTVEELKEQLDLREIKYAKKAVKDDLIKLLKEAD